MLDLTFYPKNSQDNLEPYSVDVPEDLYEFLARSEFSKIGQSVFTNIEVNNEEQNLLLVELTTENREKMRIFFLEKIAIESEDLVKKLGDSPSKQEYQQLANRLEVLQELRKCIENQHFSYLQRT
jgi:hypothetical protein